MNQPLKRGFFVTATGTDIGKTYVSAGLLRHWRQAGKRISALKPVMSGFDRSQAAASDAGELLQAMGLPVDDAHLDRLAPWRFAAPLSPDMAALREGKTIDPEAVTAFCRRHLENDLDYILVEGVGGVMVPLSESGTVLDWMASLKLPTILVAGSYLGTISHTLTALAVLKMRQISVASVVLNESPVSPVPLSETAAALKQHWGGIDIVCLNRHATASEFSRLAEQLERTA
ncbi:dethiobiotin synthase [Dongia soli]|uniref:ATP-dependent dethiobiotin synthetase BioD n=1 Tax=Dongia soli TaxID=600628 RepID=A0ABU5ECC7_9PROT|nr:dethiobiotin synthase [Dongia soli]MDY0883699.1 dethiobiotin synthase [Dongia soli]